MSVLLYAVQADIMIMAQRSAFATADVTRSLGWLASLFVYFYGLSKYTHMQVSATPVTELVTAEIPKQTSNFL
jgi:hypothetical protein